jgi:hypothetical protein
MFSIAREAVPEDALLKTYRGGVHPERWGEGRCTRLNFTVQYSAGVAGLLVDSAANGWRDATLGA